jgi:uncharacterized protein YjbI with pentapeptide repeats
MSRTDHLVTLFARENSQLPEATMAESQEKEITSMEPDSAKDHLLEGQLYDKDFSGQNLREADMSRSEFVYVGLNAADLTAPTDEGPCLMVRKSSGETLAMRPTTNNMDRCLKRDKLTASETT